MPGTQKGPKVSGNIFFFQTAFSGEKERETRLILIVVVVILAVVVVSVIVIIVGHKNLTLKFGQNFVVVVDPET